MFKIFRLLYITHITIKYRLDEILKHRFFFHLIRILIPIYWIKNNNPLEVRIKNAIEDLGPIFVKFAQILSTRVDLLPREIVKELSKLQDNTKPFDSNIAINIIEKSFDKKIDSIFKHFEKKPIASASIAQVHKATLFSGENVAVKILRPNIHKQSKKDIQVLKFICKLLEFLSSTQKKLNPYDTVVEIENILKNELNLQQEAANCSQMKRNFKNTFDLYIPKVYWQYVKRNVLVTEFVSGVKITDIELLKKSEVDLKKLAQIGIRFFLIQAFNHCFFHADMHPGNIFVDISDKNNPKYILVDFGIMGTLSKVDQNYLAENCLAVLNKDYNKIAMLHIKSGWVAKGTRVDEFASAIRSICEPIFALSLKEISVADTLFNLFDTARKFKMRILPQLILLQKTLINLEGIGRQLDPKMNIYKISRAFFDEFFKNELSIKNVGKYIKTQAPLILDKIPEIENLISELKPKEKRQNYFAPIAITVMSLGIASLSPEILGWLQANSKVVIVSGIILSSFAIIQPE